MKLFSTLINLQYIFVFEWVRIRRIFGNKVTMIIMMHDVKMHFSLTQKSRAKEIPKNRIHLWHTDKLYWDYRKLAVLLH